MSRDFGIKFFFIAPVFLRALGNDHAYLIVPFRIFSLEICEKICNSKGTTSVSDTGGNENNYFFWEQFTFFFF
jgi:hypothetical protein